MENNELMTTEMEQEIGMEDYDTECTDGRFGKLAGLGLLGVCVAGAATYLWNKTKDKREEKQINRLRNKGYVIFKEDECEVREVEVDDEEEVETTEE